MENISFSPETNILDAVDSDERVADVFKKLNLHCLDCVASEKETLNDAARYHNADLQQILHELNRLKSPQA